MPWNCHWTVIKNFQVLFSIMVVQYLNFFHFALFFLVISTHFPKIFPDFQIVCHPNCLLSDMFRYSFWFVKAWNWHLLLFRNYILLFLSFWKKTEYFAEKAVKAGTLNLIFRHCIPVEVILIQQSLITQDVT